MHGNLISVFSFLPRVTNISSLDISKQLLEKKTKQKQSKTI